MSFIHIDKRDDQPNSITVNTANNQLNRTTTYVGPISLIHTHAFSSLVTDERMDERTHW